MIEYPLAHIHPEAKIGANVHISPFSYIDKDVVIDDGCWIGPNVTIMNGARIKKNCSIFPGAVISAIPQDLKYNGEETTVEIGENTTIRECVTINRGTIANGKTIVGNNALIMAYAHIAHDCILGDHVILANSANLAGHVIIDEWAIIGGLSAVHQFTHIGKHVMISGGSLIRKDIPPYTKAAHEPISYVGINSIGLSRRGFTQEQINIIQDIYRILFVKKTNTSQALEEIETTIPNTPEKNEIISFVKSSTRGIMKGYTKSEY